MTRTGYPPWPREVRTPDGALGIHIGQGLYEFNVPIHVEAQPETKRLRAYWDRKANLFGFIGHPGAQELAAKDWMPLEITKPGIEKYLPGDWKNW